MATAAPTTAPRLATRGAALIALGLLWACGSADDSSDATVDDGSGGGLAGLAEVVPPAFIDDEDWRATSDVLAALPDAVHLKTNTQSFNRQYYFAVLDGALYIKPNLERTGLDRPWEELELTEDMRGRVTMVAADDHGLVIFDDDRRLQWTMNEALDVPLVPVWQREWGAPLAMGPGLTLPGPIVTWGWSVLTPSRDGYFLDPAGNEQPVGLGTVAHIWLLNDDGQRITYVDPILPIDTSYEMCGPHRGRFRSVNLSASGSTVMVINRHGDIYTRLYDFDISGADTLFFEYTYESMPGVSGAPIKLPAPDWIQHPKIDGEITDRISLHKLERGSDSRVLRVEGRDADGRVGFFEKAITAMDGDDWAFHVTDAPLRGNVLDNDPDDRSLDTLGDGEDRRYDAEDTDASLSLLDFNLYCAPSTLRVTFASGAELDLVLHHADAIRQQPREGRLTDVPRELNGAIEVPVETWEGREGLDAEVATFLDAHLASDSRFTTLPLTASLDRVTLGSWSFDHVED